MLVRKDTYLENLEIYQSIRSFVIKKDLQIEKQNYIERYLKVLTEFGFTTRFYQNTPPIYEGIKLEKRGGDGFVHYDGLQDYVAANTKITALSFDKLDYLFRIFFALLSAILLLNLLYRYVVSIVIAQIQNWLFRFISFARFTYRYCC